MNQGDIILVGLRDFQDSKADVILKYTPDEARNLKTYGEFPESVRINETVTFVEDGFDEDIEFGDEISSEEEEDDVDNIWDSVVTKNKQLSFPRLHIVHAWSLWERSEHFVIKSKLLGHYFLQYTIDINAKNKTEHKMK